MRRSIGRASCAIAFEGLKFLFTSKTRLVKFILGRIKLFILEKKVCTPGLMGLAMCKGSEKEEDFGVGAFCDLHFHSQSLP